ncbi:MAG: hypothetical protein Q8O09_00610 [Bacillota bacterium]|nr:hypothetical protein [Bacillota bacterium]
MKRGFSLLFMAAVLAVSILVFPVNSLNAAKNALTLWFGAVLPALLPFFVGASLLEQCGAADCLAILLGSAARRFFKCSGYSVYAYVMSIISGYPAGAKLLSQYVLEGKIDRSEAARTAPLCSTSGPLFMIGTVGVAMLGDPAAGYVIALSHYLGSLVVGLVLSIGAKMPRPMEKGSVLSRAKEAFIKKSSHASPLGSALSDAISEGMATMLLICGYIMVFFLLTESLRASGILAALSKLLSFPLSAMGFPASQAQPLLSGVIEITTGCRAASSAGGALPDLAAILTFIISFGGLSVLAQSLGFLSRASIKPGRFILSKLFHGIVSAAFAYVFTTAFIGGTRPAFLPAVESMGKTSALWGGITFAGFILLFIITVLLKKKCALNMNRTVKH